ncbi:hypothetical protein LR48_Vigan272s004500 [Vigna angularis]|uniref:UvrD-like helicase ATP-binding domain-containing protein n=1 Tax=Phaseolus angularis TaxID=3914 RepID=A0A0L9T7A5_PHAAN|nr:hypothetical protein LR48_Vigan272s004500 [Vigna angularis]
MMQGDPSRKKKDNDDYGFTNLIFSWSIENILDEDLYRNKVEKIAQTFQSTDHYFGSYTYPLLEETRAQLCSSMEIIHQAPYAEVIGLKEAKSDHNNLYKLAINCWKNRFTHSGEPYKTFPGDFLILSDYRPEAIKDLQRNGRMWSFVSVRTTEDGNDDDFKLKVEASKELDPTNWRNKPLFLIFLTNMIPNKRIWAALHMPGNFEILKQILCTKEDEECSNCSSQANALGDDRSYQVLLSELNISQKEAISSCLSGLDCNHKTAAKLIWGPPGTGKTRTLATLLFALFKMKYRVLVCASTNVAIKEVATRVVNIMKEAHSKESGDLFCSMSEVLLLGNKDKLKIGDNVEDIHLDHRVQELTKALFPTATGFRSCIKSMIDLLEYCVSDYRLFVEIELNNKRNLKSFLEFLRERFQSVKGILESCISILCTHVGRSLLKHNIRKLVCLSEALESFQGYLFQSNLPSKELEKLFTYKNLPEMDSWSFDGAAYKLYMKRIECLNALMTVLDSIDEFILIKSYKYESIRQFCFQTSSLIFCTASGSHKLRSLTMKPFDILVIDEAAQLKECESIIPLLLPGIKHAILAGDELQLQSMVRSNVSKEAGFGRSLFERLSSLGYPKSLLKDAPNVGRYDFGKKYLPGPMFGPYSFINVVGGKEQFDDEGSSYKNLAEVAVVMTILKNLHKAWLTKKHELSIGIVTPYAGQVAAIQEKLGKIYESDDGFNVVVMSVDGFQGGEKDIIMLSTVRTSSRSSLEFISSPQRTNVALTRARHCLWILGNEWAITKNENVWNAIVLDAKKRNCFFNAEQDEEMAKAILDSKKEADQFDDLLDTNSVLFKNKLWKVYFSDKFLRSFKRLKFEASKNKVINLIERLSSGWRPKWNNVDLCCENSTHILKKFKVETNYVICSIEIVKGSRYIQVLKIWNILPLEDIQQLAKRLENLFKRYTDEYIRMCKKKGTNNLRDMEFPLNWPLSANIQKFENVHNNVNDGDANDTSEADKSRAEHEECTLLMKYCSISRDYMLHGKDSLQADLPYEVTDEQRNIIRFSKSTFVLGRSGTGKTTVLITKLIQNEILHRKGVQQWYGSGINANQEQSKDIATETERPVLRQLFVTLSAGLCQKVQHHVSLLKRSLREVGPVAESSAKQFENIPDSFDGLSYDLYPLVITFRKFMFMLDGTLGNSYFDRFYNANLGSRLDALETLMMKEVNYERFESLYWPHFKVQLRKKLDSYIVFTEIMSHIKGGTGTIEHGKLSREEYCDVSENRTSGLSTETRIMIYDIFQDYETMKMKNGDFDLGDLVIDLHSRLRAERYKGDKMNFVYIDEVQDLTMAQIGLFRYICRNVEEGFVFCGDTAQTVGRGIDFRFKDVRSIFFKKFVLESESWNHDKRKGKGCISDIFVLSQNFCTNAEVLQLSQSIIELLHHFFPHSIDLLKEETGLIEGKIPLVIRSRNDADSLLKAFGRSRGERVVLVRDNLARNEVLRVAGKEALVLTVLQCKGLEFEDVLLYNFFSSSPLQRRWRVIYDYMKEQQIQAYSRGCFDQDSNHSVFCSELKQLYVAVTRTRSRLWIYEDTEVFSTPMFDYWKMKNLVQFQ